MTFQLFIEQEIKEGLAQGKTPYSIGKEIAAWVEKLFETSIPQETLKSRAARIQKKIGSNEPSSPTPAIPSEIPEKQTFQPIRDEQGRFAGGTALGPGRAPIIL